ncbi:hypothetical protein STCU_12202 [Strigomonas culicis]|uniref:Uncharacterized protein n=1 Tax=Strigomonas culicis TaxID=28005 RepID=S9UKR1_9TRYP|nr:hypothetical protein STCU_12202 [Strigomonas culicis]|eukprot:EPY15251.1 hypothetical protein STCU_12202 [Strigomonas culicis]
MQRRWVALSGKLLPQQRLSAPLRSGSTAAPPEPPLYAGSGSSYYCKGPESERGQQRRLIHPGKRTLEAHEREVRCGTRVHVVNMETPPISREQAERWKLDRLIYKRPMHFRPSKPHPVLLLPAEQRIYSLGPEMDQLDRVYRQKGLFTPSEVAHVFIPIVPSFFVEMRHVVECIPPDVLLVIDRHIPRARFSTIFEHYPMLFKFHRRKYQRSAVKLNDDMWFIQAHPDFQKANVRHREHNADYLSSVGGGAVVTPAAPRRREQHAPHACGGSGVDR